MRKYFKTGGYSREFTPPRGAGKAYPVTRIPAGFFNAVRAKAKAETISLRTLTLRLWRAWLDGDIRTPAPKDEP